MKLSVLNLVPIRQGESSREAMEAMVRLAQKVEDLGYERYWIAEHHNTSTFASSATQLLIQHTLAQTSHIRVGSGGVMLPNHSPYLVAEQYGTLETLYPNRLDLGLGRAPGTDMETAQALRRQDMGREHYFPQEVEELAGYFAGSRPVHAYPAEGLDLPLYILGSSTDSAYLAAELGLPYAFASHFAPGMMVEAVAIYRANFKPSQQLSQPYVILGANAVLADSQEEADRLSTTQLKMILDIVTNQRNGLQPPSTSEEEVWTKLKKAKQAPHFGPVALSDDQVVRQEKALVKRMTAVSFKGDKARVAKQLTDLKARLDFDELMVVSYIYDEQAQHHSYQLLKEVLDEIAE